jgi:hypothetical protein
MKEEMTKRDNALDGLSRNLRLEKAVDCLQAAAKITPEG